MGIAPPSKPLSLSLSSSNSTSSVPQRQHQVPKKPYQKSRRGGGGSLLLPLPTGGKNSTNNNVLVRLILLQDWQKVLIRARLFPKELAHPFRLTLQALQQQQSRSAEAGVGAAVTTASTDGDDKNKNGISCGDNSSKGKSKRFDFKILPLHLVCALDPPVAVVRLLLELYGDAATVPLLPTNNGGIGSIGKPSSLFRHRRSSPSAAVVVAASGGSAAASMSPRGRRQQHRRPWSAARRRIRKLILLGQTKKKKNYLGTQSVLLKSNGGGCYHNASAPSSTTAPVNEIFSPTAGSELIPGEDRLRLLAKPEEVSVYYSAHEEEEYGGEEVNLTDDEGDGDEELCSSSISSRHSWTNRVLLNDPSFGNNSSGSNSNSNDDSANKNVILQLSPSGGVIPLPLPQDNSNETDSTSESSNANNKNGTDAFFRVRWDMQPLLEEVSVRGGLLPLHIACLYMASTDVLKALLDAFPIAALVSALRNSRTDILCMQLYKAHLEQWFPSSLKQSDVLGMLPIHWAAAGWRLPPLAPPPPPSCLLPPDLVMNPPPGPIEVLRLLKQVIPETVRVKSGNHAMTPDQYVQECMEDGEYKESCIRVLMEDAVGDDDDDIRSLSTASCSLLFVDSMSETSSLCFDGKAVVGISSLISKQNWPAVLELIEGTFSPLIMTFPPLMLLVLLLGIFELIRFYAFMYMSQTIQEAPQSGCTGLIRIKFRFRSSGSACLFIWHVLTVHQSGSFSCSSKPTPKAPPLQTRILDASHCIRFAKLCRPILFCRPSDFCLKVRTYIQFVTNSMRT